MKKMILLMGVGLLTACAAPSTIDNIRENSERKITFEVDQPYKVVYKHILQQTRQCYLNRPTSTQLIVSDSRSNRDREGYITVKHVYGKTQEHTQWLTDVKALGDNRAQVVTYYAPAWGARAEAEMVKRWIQDNSQDCVS